MSDASSEGLGPASISIRRKVEWVDTDASGHWHNTAVVRLCEMAESALFAALGLEDVFYSNGAPRVRMEAHYLRSARFGDEVEITCSVSDVGRSKIVLSHEVGVRGDVLARLDVTAVLVDEGGSPRSFDSEVRRTLLEAGPQGIDGNA